MPRRSDSDEGERDSDVEMQDGTNSGGRGNDKGLKSAKGKGRTIQPHSDDDRGGSYDDDEGRAKVPKQQQRTQAEESASKDEQDEEEEEQLQHDIYGGNQTFDMRQTIEQQRGIKQQLRTQAAEIESSRSNILDLSVSDLTKQVERTNLLFKSIKAPSEAVLDSRMLMMQSDMGAIKARQLKVDSNAFDTDEFLIKALHFIGGKVGGNNGRKLNWETMGKALVRESRRVPIIEFMCGPLGIEIKAKRARNQNARQKVNENDRVRLKELTVDQVKASVTESASMVFALAERLQEVCDEDVNGGAVAFLPFIVNPQSFGQTVENMFHLSFLIKEGKVAIEIDEEESHTTFGDAVLFRCNPPTAEDIAGGTKKNHIIFELDKEIWRSAIEAYRLVESIIPTRPERIEGRFKAGES